MSFLLKHNLIRAINQKELMISFQHWKKITWSTLQTIFGLWIGH